VIGPGEPLIVASGAATIDVWWGSHEPADVEALMAYRPPEGIRVAVGNPGYGTAGFRESHAQALQATRVMALAGAAGGSVTNYHGVELVSLLASDLPRARAFVSTRLGPLASTGEPAARLRDTVLTFLATKGSSAVVAKKLYVHQNTVSHRIKRAEELLGRSLTEDPVELICALTLAAALGPAVLSNDNVESAPASPARGSRSARDLQLVIAGQTGQCT
jgi:sugar diacid utilization regulator